MNWKTIFFDREDNVDFAVVLGIAAFITLVGLQIYACVVRGQPFEPISFGTGSMGISTGIGAHKLMGNKGDYDGDNK